MVMPHRPSSSGLQKIRRELQRRKHKALGATPPATKKTSPMQPPRTRPPRDSSTLPLSEGTDAPPPRRPRPQDLVSPSSGISVPPPAPPSRLGSSASLFSCAGTPSTAGGLLKPGTRVSVRTRTRHLIDGKTLVFWYPATVVSATDDAGYEVIYDGKMPPDNPFSTVHVPIHHVKVGPVEPSSLLAVSSHAASLSCSAAKTIAAGSKRSSDVLPAAGRLTRATESRRLVRNSAMEMQPPPPRPITETKTAAPRPTTAGKSPSITRSLISEKGRRELDEYRRSLGI